MGDNKAKCEDGTTLDTYSHVLPGMQEKAVNALTEVLLQEGSKVLQMAVTGV